MNIRFTSNNNIVITGLPELYDYEQKEVIDNIQRILKPFCNEDMY